MDYRVDKAGVVHARIGKISFGVAKLTENARTLLGAVVRAKPASAKGNYVQSVALASTMGPGVRVDPARPGPSRRPPELALTIRPGCGVQISEEAKKPIWSRISSSRFNRASMALVSEYKGMKAAESAELRRRLKAVRGELRVAKNTLVRRAIQETNYAGLDGHLGGPVGVIFSFDDPIEVAKTVTSFKEPGERFKLRGGVLEGKPISREEVHALANMPPKRS